MNKFQTFLETRNYQQSVHANLDHMDTVWRDWTIVPSVVSGHDAMGKPEFDFKIPGGYISAPSLYNGAGVCHLCNAPCKQKFPIKNDDKKWLLWVGSECVARFDENKRSGPQLQQEASLRANQALLASIYELLSIGERMMGVQELANKYLGHGVRYEDGKWIATRTTASSYRPESQAALLSKGWRPSQSRQFLYEKDDAVFNPEAMDGLKHAPLIVQKYMSAFINLVKIIGGRHYATTEPRKLNVWAQNNRQTIENFISSFHVMLEKLREVDKQSKSLANLDDAELDVLAQEYLTIPNRSKLLTKLD